MTNPLKTFIRISGPEAALPESTGRVVLGFQLINHPLDEPGENCFGNAGLLGVVLLKLQRHLPTSLSVQKNQHPGAGVCLWCLEADRRTQFCAPCTVCHIFQKISKGDDDKKVNDMIKNMMTRNITENDKPSTKKTFWQKMIT